MHRLFLSHAGIDGDAALALAQRLEDAARASGEELVVWIDRRDLGHGPWLDQIDSGFKASTAFAVLVGTGGVINWVWREVKLALDRTIAEPAYPLLPILHALIPAASAWQEAKGRARHDRLARGHELEPYLSLAERRSTWRSLPSSGTISRRVRQRHGGAPCSAGVRLWCWPG
jgi:hypothetical protein